MTTCSLIQTIHVFYNPINNCVNAAQKKLINVIFSFNVNCKHIEQTGFLLYSCVSFPRDLFLHFSEFVP